MDLYVESDWSGWDSNTVVRLSDGTKWKQDEYFYEYHYAYRPDHDRRDAGRGDESRCTGQAGLVGGRRRGLGWAPYPCPCSRIVRRLLPTGTPAA